MSIVGALQTRPEQRSHPYKALTTCKTRQTPHFSQPSIRAQTFCKSCFPRTRRLRDSNSFSFRRSGSSMLQVCLRKSLLTAACSTALTSMGSNEALPIVSGSWLPMTWDTVRPGRRCRMRCRHSRCHCLSPPSFRAKQVFSPVV